MNEGLTTLPLARKGDLLNLHIPRCRNRKDIGQKANKRFHIGIAATALRPERGQREAVIYEIVHDGNEFPAHDAIRRS